MTIALNRNRLFLIAIVSSLFIACNQDDSVPENQDASTFNIVDNNRAAQADSTIEGTLNIMENGYVEGEEGRSQVNSLFPECTTITIQPDGDGGVITLDFGDGCILNNGATVTGIITLHYGPFDGGTRTIDYTFNGYTYNNNLVSGGGQIFRQIANEDGFPQSTVNETIMVAFPDTDVTATRTGMRVAVWVEGVGSGTWADNVYHVTGNWDTQFTNGFNRTGLVTEKLVRKLNCVYIVSGRLEITQNSFEGTLDWGDGACDNQAVLEVGGLMYDIVL